MPSAYENSRSKVESRFCRHRRCKHLRLNDLFPASERVDYFPDRLSQRAGAVIVPAASETPHMDQRL